jgi:hypothetical protein
MPWNFQGPSKGCSLGKAVGRVLMAPCWESMGEGNGAFRSGEGMWSMSLRGRVMQSEVGAAVRRGGCEVLMRCLEDGGPPGGCGGLPCNQ